MEQADEFYCRLGLGFLEPGSTFRLVIKIGITAGERSSRRQDSLWICSTVSVAGGGMRRGENGIPLRLVL